MSNQEVIIREIYGHALLLAHQRKCPALKLISEKASQSVDSIAAGCSAGLEAFTYPVAMQQKEICSKEIRPASFEKCEGCNEYYGANLMTVHQSKCARWKSLYGNRSVTKQPVPTTITSCGGDQNVYTTLSDTCGVKSPPWLEAAEKRLQHHSNVPVDTTSSQLQKNIQCGSMINTGLNLSRSFQNPKSTYSNSQQSSVQRSQIRFVAVDFGDDSDNGDVLSSGSNPVQSNEVMDGGAQGELDLGSIEVECPVCGDFYPSCIIERHAATCGL